MPKIRRAHNFKSQRLPVLFLCRRGQRAAAYSVAKAGFDAKFWLSPARLAVNHGFRPHDLREIAGIIEQHEPMILEKWNEFFRP